MITRSWPLLAFFMASMPAAANDIGVYAGIDAGVAIRSGTSHTKDGGVTIGGVGAGVVHDVQFDPARAYGGHVGYRFTPRFSTELSFQRVDGDVFWKARFSGTDTSSFAAKAVSDLWMVNAIYAHPMSPTTSVRVKGGLGASINRLQDIGEVTTNNQRYRLAPGRATSLAATLGVGVTQQLLPSVSIGANVDANYFGAFETGSSRTESGLPRTINPYRLSKTWGGTVSGFLRVNF